MRWLTLIFLLLVLSVPLGLAVFAVLCTDSRAAIEGAPIISREGVERARQLLREHDPRKLRSGETKTVVMNEEELNLVLNHLIERAGGGGAALTVSDGDLSVIATIDLARFAPDRYLNIDATIRETAGSTAVEHLTLGDIAIPRGIVGALVGFAAEHLYRASGVHDAAEFIREVKLQPQRVAVTYEWKAGIVDAVRDRLIPADDRERLRIYHAELAGAVSDHGEQLSFASLLEALFRLAASRSGTADPTLENRAAIIVMAAYINGRSLEALAPGASSWPAAQRKRLRLRGRRDFVQHFSTSAALAVAGGGAVANAIGLVKEIEDADGGSGFSFRDLAADMAGTELGRFAVGAEADARTVQRRALEGFTDADLMPDVEGLRENLSDAEFNAAFGGVGGEAYSAVVRDIERRIAALPVYAR